MDMMLRLQTYISGFKKLFQYRKKLAIVAGVKQGKWCNFAEKQILK